MRYAIFGAGRAGENMAAYLRHLGHVIEIITRAEVEETRANCCEKVSHADIVIAAIPDSALQPWFENWQEVIGERPAVHLSGAVTVSGMSGFHPLYSFPKAVIDMAIMARIPFACSEQGPEFSELFPGAQNPHFMLRDDDRAYYHALAVLSGNLSAFLWNKTADPFEKLSGMPAQDIMRVYLQSLVDRFLEAPKKSLTGPVARRDANTVQKNLDALKSQAELSQLYQAFLDTAWPDYSH
ncbi:MAG: stilbene synthase [Hyphococcus sp.]|nr:MAG: stilbene synthase [Marinicaulis sp.]